MLGTKKSLCRWREIKKVILVTNNDNPDEEPVKVSYNRGGKITKISNSDYLYNIRYDDKGEIADVNTVGRKDGGSLIREKPKTTGIEGCDGVAGTKQRKLYHVQTVAILDWITRDLITRQEESQRKFVLVHRKVFLRSQELSLTRKLSIT